VVAFIFTFQIIGWRVGLWRAICVPIVGVLAGLCMAFLFRREEAVRRAEAHAAAPRLAVTHQPMGRVWLLLGALLASVVFGAWEMPWQPKVAGMAVVALLVAAIAARLYHRDELKAWGGETWGLVKLVVPVLVPMLLIIGGAAAYIDIKDVYHWVGPVPEDAGFWAHMKPILIADVFGALMYFPILSEVAFTKAFLKSGMDVGPALAVLLTGAGLSLPGLFIISRAIGWGKSLAYEGIVVVIVALVCYLFSSEIGEYICECMMLGK
jgi:hypothetical protein